MQHIQWFLFDSSWYFSIDLILFLSFFTCLSLVLLSLSLLNIGCPHESWPHLMSCSFFFCYHLFTCTCDAYVQYNITFFVLVRYQIFSWHHCYICTHTLAQFLYFISITFHLKLLCPADAPSTAAFEGMLSTPPAPAKMFPVSSTNDTGMSTRVNVYCVMVLPDIVSSLFSYPGRNPKRGSWNHQGASGCLESCCRASCPTPASSQPTIHWPRVDCVSARCLWRQAGNSSELCIWLGEELDLRTYCMTVVAVAASWTWSNAICKLLVCCARHCARQQAA